VHDAIAGDPDAFTELYLRHEKPVRHQSTQYFATRICKSAPMRPRSQARARSLRRRSFLRW
jgi:hypothetical protein